MMVAPPLLVAIDQAPEGVLVAVIARAATRLQELQGGVEAPAPAPSDPLINPDLIPLGVLASRLKRSKEGLRKWALRNGLLVKIMGRLHVSESGARALLEKST